MATSNEEEEGEEEGEEDVEGISGGSESGYSRARGQDDSSCTRGAGDTPIVR